MANGTATLLGARDERSVYVRRMKEVIAEHVEDRGGLDAMSAAEKSLIRRVAVMTIELEKLETRFAEDETVGERTLDLYNRTAGNLGRILERLGLKRKEKAPRTIEGHLAAKRRRANA
ncbi:hypothetical protein EJ066_26265 [Mesorhizobium sp. M9A.F.Ca.ET.002.03.1.2]|uniref:hypothetical protein n=1 Tax=Mesorhizobium sp. M9A.F.Ca.ET.002.03.1.2 TaxID=2493668 RepID=UPI000F76171A|nr:hypothetical protein [Mesorhizobium sp. M9A.F.Ca.ET.002.03.1.2]AZO00348.1 hypothetical protein EJ066_26265 [Mesorhizobium sp. M9A.F.Ca.ET.002.03.1.2]